MVELLCCEAKRSIAISYVARKTATACRHNHAYGFSQKYCQETAMGLLRTHSRSTVFFVIDFFGTFLE